MPCDLSSLTDLRRVTDFQLVQIFSLVVRMGMMTTKSFTRSTPKLEVLIISKRKKKSHHPDGKHSATLLMDLEPVALQGSARVSITLSQ